MRTKPRALQCDNGVAVHDVRVRYELKHQYAVRDQCYRAVLRWTRPELQIDKPSRHVFRFAP